MEALSTHRQASYRRLSVEEERALTRRYQDGDVDAGADLVEGHLRFVFKMAHSYKSSAHRFEDLVQEGAVGLLEAAKRFDPSRGHRLISYAVHWIRSRMQSDVVRHHSLVRIGTSQVQRRLFYRTAKEAAAIRAERTAQGRTDVEPHDDDLAARLNVSTRSVTEMRKRLRGTDVSLDAPRHDDSQQTVGASLPADEPNPEEWVAAKELAHAVRARVPSLMASELDDRERTILELRLLQDRPWTLAAIGKTLGITRERTRQIEFRAKGKLRRRLSDLGAWGEGTDP